MGIYNLWKFSLSSDFLRSTQNLRKYSSWFGRFLSKCTKHEKIGQIFVCFSESLNFIFYRQLWIEGRNNCLGRNKNSAFFTAASCKKGHPFWCIVNKYLALIILAALYLFSKMMMLLNIIETIIQNQTRMKLLSS